MPPRPEQPRTAAGRALLDNEKHHWALCALNIEGLDDPTVTCSCNFVYPILAIEAEARAAGSGPALTEAIRLLNYVVDDVGYNASLRDQILRFLNEGAAGSGRLDVERLARALRAAGLWPQYPEFTRVWQEHAEKIAAAYARLQASAPPLDPGETPSDNQGFSPSQPGNTYWERTPLVQNPPPSSKEGDG